jgi:hypothetical protein
MLPQKSNFKVRSSYFGEGELLSEGLFESNTRTILFKRKIKTKKNKKKATAQVFRKK